MKRARKIISFGSPNLSCGWRVMLLSKCNPILDAQALSCIICGGGRGSIEALTSYDPLKTVMASTSKFQAHAIVMIVLFSFAAGALVAIRVAHVEQVNAESDRLFELRIYHDVPGKLQVMESRFREKTSKILARHGLNVLGYWETSDRSSSENLFVFLLAHQSRDEAKKNWQAVIADPEFKEVEKAEEIEKTLDKADVIYLRPTDFSALK